jgi:hypothetical protein
MSACFSTYYRKDYASNVTNVSSIITVLRDALVNNPPAAYKWTEPVSQTFQSPARADGLFLTVTIASVSATRISYVVKDYLGIGYNNLNYAYDMSSGKPVAGAAIVPIDNNENGVADPDEVLKTKKEAVQAVAEGRYPSPPARA